MKRLITLFLLLISAVCVAQRNKDQKQMLKERDRYLFSTKIFTEDFKDKVSAVRVGGVLVVPVTINGKVYSFLFDTGAATAISSELEQDLKLTPVMQNHITDASGEQQLNRFYTIDSIRINNTSFYQVGVAGIDLSEMSKELCHKIDGIIGANLMRVCNWRVDYATGDIAFSDKRFKQEQDFLRIGFTESFSGTPEIEMNMGKYRFHATWDSGFNGSILLPDSLFFNAFKGALPPMAAGTGLYARTFFAQTKGNKYFSLPDTILMDAHVLLQVGVDISSSPSKLIGCAFMRRYSTTIINWVDHVILLGPRQLPPDSRMSYGFTPGMMDGKVLVAATWDQLSADRAGIKVGDIITAINDKDMRQVNAEQWCAIRSYLNELQDDIEVTVIHEGTEIRSRLSKQSLLNP